MPWLLNCYRCGRWVSKRKGGDPDVLDGEVGWPRCHQCVERDHAERRHKTEERVKTNTGIVGAVARGEMGRAGR